MFDGFPVFRRLQCSVALRLRSWSAQREGPFFYGPCPRGTLGGNAVAIQWLASALAESRHCHAATLPALSPFCYPPVLALLVRAWRSRCKGSRSVEPCAPVS